MEEKNVVRGSSEWRWRGVRACGFGSEGGTQDTYRVSSFRVLSPSSGPLLVGPVCPDGSSLDCGCNFVVVEVLLQLLAKRDEAKARREMRN